jgi:hypothetical protein
LFVHETNKQDRSSNFQFFNFLRIVEAYSILIMKAVAQRGNTWALRTKLRFYSESLGFWALSVSGNQEPRKRNVSETACFRPEVS